MTDSPRARSAVRRVSNLSQDRGQLSSGFPLLVGQDRIYGAPGQVPTYDTVLVRGRSRLPAVERAVYQHGAQYIGHDRIYGSDGKVATYDWPLVRTKPRGRDFGDIFNGTIGFPVGAPFAQLDWPLVQIKPRARDLSVTFNGTGYIGHAQIYGQDGQVPAYDMPLVIRRPRGRDLGVTFNGTIFIPVVTAQPFGQYDWPLVGRSPKARDASVALNGTIGFPAVVAVPFAQLDWPMARVPMKPRDLTIAQSGVVYIGQDAIHGAPGEVPAYDWPLTQTKARGRDFGYTFNGTIYVPPGIVLTHTTVGAQLAAGQNQGIYTRFHIPADSGATSLTITPYWAAAAADASAHVVRWQANVLKADPTVALTNSGQSVTWTGAAASRIANVVVADTPQILLGSFAPGDLVRIELDRVGADALDTFTQTVNLIGFEISYTSTL